MSACLCDVISETKPFDRIFKIWHGRLSVTIIELFQIAIIMSIGKLTLQKGRKWAVSYAAYHISYETGYYQYLYDASRHFSVY